MTRIWQWKTGAYLKMLVKLALVVVAGGAILTSIGCGAGLLPVLVGTGAFVAGANSQQAADGTNGINCWDLNGDGINDETEDANGDGEFSALDCLGNAGMAGRDGQNGLDGDQGSQGERGEVGGQGDQGPSGSPGEDGSSGLSGIEDCWVICDGPPGQQEPCEIVCPE